MAHISEQALQTLFTEARTFSGWQDKDVEDTQLQQIYELMKWAPTSVNSSPIRIVFVKSPMKKNQLISTLAETNQAKVQAAPVTAIIAMDEKFYEKLPQLFPHAPHFQELFLSNPQLANDTAFRNSSLQGAYFILATRALGLDCGPLSGFNNQKLDELFFAGTSWKSNFICNIGYGNREMLYPRGPRLAFEEACIII